MNYLSKCTDGQIGELMRCYSSNYTGIAIKRLKDCVDVELIVDDIPESYSLTDYNVANYDWDDQNEPCLRNYRNKMLEWFGSQYAADYLLNC